MLLFYNCIAQRKNTIAMRIRITNSNTFAAGPRLSDTYESICNDHPYNEWCLSHGYGKYSFWTSPFPIFISIALILVLLMYQAMK